MVKIGQWAGTYKWPGQIKDVRIYDTADANAVLVPEYDLVAGHHNEESSFPVNLGLANAVGIKDASFTASAWVKRDTSAANSGDQTILGMDEGGDNKQLHLVLASILWASTATTVQARPTTRRVNGSMLLSCTTKQPRKWTFS
jgi:hypothetical protein